jgi:hypothetical protein
VKDASPWPGRRASWSFTGPPLFAILLSRHARRAGSATTRSRARGILSLTKHYPADRLERACARALHFRTLTYKSVEAILLNGLDREQLPGDELQQAALPLHENIRGSRYYLN